MELAKGRKEFADSRDCILTGLVDSEGFAILPDHGHPDGLLQLLIEILAPADVHVLFFRHPRRRHEIEDQP
jgi:hypothetical protein